MTRHPIIDRFVKCLNEAYVICERFEEEFERPPTREECATAATLYIEMNKQGGKAANKARAQTSADPRLEDIPDCCPDCGDDMWDNRDDKKGDRSPDFKCKDKNCGKAIWLTPPPAKKKKQAPQGPISEPDDDLPF